MGVIRRARMLWHFGLVGFLDLGGLRTGAF